jgi:starch synthase
LYDTVRNFDPRTGIGTGFTFEEYSPRALLGTLQWALVVYTNREVWRHIQAAGMHENHSWSSSALEYVRLFERAMRQ